MTGFILACLLAGLGVAVILIGLVKSASGGQKKPTRPDSLEWWTPFIGQLRDEVSALLSYPRETSNETEEKIA